MVVLSVALELELELALAHCSVLSQHVLMSTVCLDCLEALALDDLRGMTSRVAYRGALDLEGERVLESGALGGLVGDLDSVRLQLTERTVDGPGEGLGLDINAGYASRVSDWLSDQIRGPTYKRWNRGWQGWSGCFHPRARWSRDL